MRKLLVILLMLASSVVMAQETSTPENEPTTFMRALGLIAAIPSVQDAGQIVSYGANHEALLARGLPIPIDWGMYETLGENALFLLATPYPGFSNFATTIRMGGSEYAQAVGFDFFEIEAAIEVGMPPTHGQILLGAFDVGAVIAAHEARGYTTESKSEAGTLLCPPEGCDSGQKARVSGVDRSNPFGGELGQMKPIFVGDGVIVVAGDFAVLQDLIAPVQSDAAALGDLPEVQALANTLASYPLVPAVMVFDPALQPDGAPDPDARAILDAAPLPPYELMAIASAADADAQTETGLTLLVYRDAADAETAAASIDARMALHSARPGISYADIYGEAGTLELARVVSDEATGLSVVVLQISGERPPAERVDGKFVASHRPFTLFLQSIMRQDFLWLTVE